MNTPQDAALDKAVLGLFQGMNSAFLTTIYCGLRFNWDDHIPTACTNGRRLQINPTWFLSLTERSRVALLAHELWHVAYMHMLRVGTRDFRRFNVAADHAINLMLLASGYFFDMPCLADPRFTGMSAEEIYDVLEQENAPIELPFGEDFEAPQGELDKSDETPIPAEIIQADITALILRAATVEKMSAAAGSMPSDFTELIDQLLAPKIRWETLFQRWMTARSEVESVWSRPNRRYHDMYLPSRGGDKGLSHLVHLIDSSCSMTNAQLTVINSELKGVKEQFDPDKMTVISFDTVVQDIWEFGAGNDLNRLEIHGRGGTNLDEPFALVAKMQPDAMVVFSDMYVGIPEQIKGVPVLWVCLDNPEWVPPYGDVIHIDSSTPTTA